MHHKFDNNKITMTHFSTQIKNQVRNFIVYITPGYLIEFLNENKLTFKENKYEDEDFLILNITHDNDINLELLLSKYLNDDIKIKINDVFLFNNIHVQNDDNICFTLFDHRSNNIIQIDKQYKDFMNDDVSLIYKRSSYEKLKQ